MFQDDYGLYKKLMTGTEIKSLISRTIEEWFLVEPALFSIACTHTFVENDRMCLPMRSGKMRIEYCPHEMQGWSELRIRQRLKAELIRILLGHPYQRQPYGATRAAMMLTSEVTLKDLYGRLSDVLSVPPDLQVPGGLTYEEYYPYVVDYMEIPRTSPKYDIEGLFDDGGGGATDDENIQPRLSDPHEDIHVSGEGDNDRSSEERDQMTGGQELELCGNGYSDGDGQSGRKESDSDADGATDDENVEKQPDPYEQGAELWEEDSMAQEQIRDVVGKLQEIRKWGSLSGKLVETIIASAVVKLDYRRIIRMFRTSLLSSKRYLSRMRPSRRYGFQYMGSKRELSARLLVAVDVSQSVSSWQVSKALSIINRFFKYGIECIDVLQFDAAITVAASPMKKAMKNLEITGRGGTCFQDAIDFFTESSYDGLIFITDGYADRPDLPKHWKGSILWLLYEEPTEENTWIRDFPRSRYLVIP